MDLHSFDTQKLKKWFLQKKRDLPWRQNCTAYAVWVSEVMLQQTQVSVVIPYFERWMQRFPTISDLACASSDEVLKMWEGLGYYSRARNLHEGAKAVLERFQGKLPQDPEQLATIKGLGPYTIGAIQSFAFHQKASAVDGNVNRVLTRFFCIKEDISKPKVQKLIRDIAFNLLPDIESWIVNEALIELGATVCQSRPKCGDCPIKKGCRAYHEGLQKEIPIKGKRVEIESLYRAVAIIRYKEHYLIHRVGKGKVMSGLHEFAYFEVESEEIDSSDLVKKASEKFLSQFSFDQWLPKQKHSFTRYRAHLIPALLTADQRQQIEGYGWHTLDELRSFAFSSGHKRILNQL